MSSRGSYRPSYGDRNPRGGYRDARDSGAYHDRRNDYSRSYDYDDYSPYDRQDARSARAYDRPSPPRYDDAPPPPPASGRGEPVYHFRGAASNHGPADSYRPGRDDNPVGDNWKPSHGGAGFDFRSGNAPSFAPTNDYPQARRGPGAENARRNYNQRNNERGGRGRGRARGRFGPRPARDRDILRAGREPTPEQLEGMNVGHSRFKVLDDMSDSESEAMDTDDSADESSKFKSQHALHVDEEDSDDDHPRAKRARVASPESKAATLEAESKPKWSNPDPYTALPPPDETDRKKKDVVQLIRKAKVDAADAGTKSAEASDFISLNFDDEASVNDEDGEVSSDNDNDDRKRSGRNASSFSHLDNLHPDRKSLPPTSDAPARGINMALPMGNLDTWPPRPPPENDPAVRDTYDDALHKQDAKDTTAKVRQKNKKRKRTEVDLGDIIEEWENLGDTDPTPWLDLDSPSTPNLQNEILDFYHYVRPRDYEEEVRQDLIRRISRAIRGQWPDLEIFAFGSFAAGLYLPTADMDLVACSSQFLDRKRASYGIGNSSMMHKFANRLKNANIIEPNTLTVIVGARVPLVKFVEKNTGLRVDISFENDSGLIAQKTFANWKRELPAMPVIVSLIKQFLVMRGLSEVFTGGLGGFSVICLVVSMIRRLQGQHGPQWDPMANLDMILMKFLQHYGNEFDLAKHGLQMEPYQYVTKKHWTPQGSKRSKPDRLLIIDPNRYNNDISGGSANVGLIFDKFYSAWYKLNDGIDKHQALYKATGERTSILDGVWGGNYEIFEVQRSRLKVLADQIRSSDARREGAPQSFPAPHAHPQPMLHTLPPKPPVVAYNSVPPPQQHGFTAMNYQNPYYPSQYPPPNPAYNMYQTDGGGPTISETTKPEVAVRPEHDQPKKPEKKQKKKKQKEEKQKKDIEQTYDNIAVDKEETATTTSVMTRSMKAASNMPPLPTNKTQPVLGLTTTNGASPPGPQQPLTQKQVQEQQLSAKALKKFKKKQKKAEKPPKTAGQRAKAGDRSRATAFKNKHPGVKVPRALSREDYKKLMQEHGSKKGKT